MTSDQREKKPLSCGTAQNISHLRLRYPLGTWNTRVSRRFGRIRELPLLLASKLQGQGPPSLGWTYYDSLGPASDGPASDCLLDIDCIDPNSSYHKHSRRQPLPQLPLSFVQLYRCTFCQLLVWIQLVVILECLLQS